MWGSKHAVNFSKGTWHQIEIRERKGPSRGIIPKCACASWALSLRAWIRGQITRGYLAPRNMRPQSSMGFGEKHSQAQEFWQNYVSHFWWSKGNVGTCRFNETRRARIRGRFRSIDAHDEQTRITVRRIMDGNKSRNPTVVDCKRVSANPRGGTSVRSRFESVLNPATTQGNASCLIARQTLQRPRILLWVGQLYRRDQRYS